MTQDYKNDVFISYTHLGAVYNWIPYLYDLLEDWLPYHLSYKPKIYIDRRIEAGTHWPSELQHELKMSRCLLAIWSPVYFNSSWCIAELESFRARERLLGIGKGQKTLGLIYPVLFTKPLKKPPEYLPLKLKKIQYYDLSDWTITSPGFKSTALHVDFEQQVKILCPVLAKMILSAPKWQADWPVRTPRRPSPKTPFTKPRL
jgi:TIR domain-containing protein